MQKLSPLYYSFFIILIAFNLEAQDCILSKSQDLQDINDEIRVLEISDDAEKSYNNESRSFVITETNYLEKNPGYSYLNEDNIPFPYIGFYKEHNAMWDTYTETFISRMPEKMTEGCQANKEYIGAMTGSYFNKLKKSPEHVDKAKCLTIAFLIQALESDCSNISEKHYLKSMGFDILPTNGLKIKHNE